MGSTTETILLPPCWNMRALNEAGPLLLPIRFSLLIKHDHVHEAFDVANGVSSTSVALGGVVHDTAGCMMGILVARVLQERGNRLILIEPSSERRRLANQYFSKSCTGIEILSPQAAQSQELIAAVDTVLEGSGNLNAVRQAINMLRKAGRLVLAGLAGGVMHESLPLELITKKELEVKGTWLTISQNTVTD